MPSLVHGVPRPAAEAGFKQTNQHSWMIANCAEYHKGERMMWVIAVSVTVKQASSGEEVTI